MKKSRYSDSQIISILKQAEAGTPVTELCREHGFGRIEVANLSMFGFSRYFFDTIQSGVDDGLAAIEAARKVGHRRAELLGP